MFVLKTNISSINWWAPQHAWNFSRGWNKICVMVTTVSVIYIYGKCYFFSIYCVFVCCLFLSSSYCCCITVTVFSMEIHLNNLKNSVSRHYFEQSISHLSIWNSTTMVLDGLDGYYFSGICLDQFWGALLKSMDIKYSHVVSQ